MVQQMDVFLQSETNSFIDMLFTVVEAKEYLEQEPETEPQPQETKLTAQQVQAKAELEAVEAKIEAVADSTTPIREEKTVQEERKARYRSPPRDRRLASRLGPREMRRFRSRSRSRSLSPRYERVRSRRRSRSPIYIDRRRRSLEFILRRGRSLERGRYGASRDSTPTRDEGGYTPTIISRKPRCNDYEKKGFCLKGDSCRYDHGSDAVVLEDAAKIAHAPPYVPGLPVSGIPYPPPLTTVPPPGFPVKRPYEGFGQEPPTKMGRGRGRGGRGGGRGGGASSMLTVRNIPATLNTITHLNGHFSRYGNLVNVQVQFEGDPSSALITFANSEDASLAFNSSEAVMNNRFIKMFWASDKGNVKNRLGGRGGHHHHQGGAKVVHGDAAMEEMDPEKSKEIKEKEMIAIQKNQEMLQTKNELLKKAEEKRKTVMAQQGGILKSKRDLLDGLIEQQKALISKIEKGKGTMKPDEKDKVMNLLKELSNSIDKTKEDIRNMISVSGLKKRTKAEVQKDLLDAEIELFTKQHDGGPEIQQIQQKVNSLKIEAARVGILPTSRAPRGRGGRARGRSRGFAGAVRGGAVRGGAPVRGRGRGRGGQVAVGDGLNSRLDRRPSMILVSGFSEESTSEELVSHFSKFGEIVETVSQDKTSMIIKYKLRKSAETAISAGKMFGDTTLLLSMHTVATNPVCSDGTEGANGEDDDSTPYQEDYLPPGLQEDENGENLNETEETEEINENLLDDEEEEGNDEERSWKRRTNEDE